MKNQKNDKPSWAELPAWMLPSLLFVAMAIYSLWANFII